jgi:alkyl hydroperoxide reductase subunit AhpF
VDICYSAISYAQLFIDRTVAVIGCGELALRAVAELAHVAKHVSLISEACNATDSPLWAKIQILPNVEPLLGYEIKAIKGDTYARSVVVAGADADREIEVDAAFVELDLIPRSKIVEELVDLDADGHILIDAHNGTSQPGIFAAGDVTSGFTEQVLIAIGEGAKAALAAYDYLLEREAEEIAAD